MTVDLTKNEANAVLQAIEDYYSDSNKEDWDCLPWMICLCRAFGKIYEAAGRDVELDFDYKKYADLEIKDEIRESKFCTVQERLDGYVCKRIV